MEELMRMIELQRQGLYCSQILVSMGLQDQDKDNPDLVRAVQALAGGHHLLLFASLLFYTKILLLVSRQAI